MGTKNEQIMVRLTEIDRTELDTLAQQLDVPASQIAREGIREKIAALKEKLAEEGRVKTPAAA